MIYALNNIMHAQCNKIDTRLYWIGKNCNDMFKIKSPRVRVRKHEESKQKMEVRSAAI